MRKSSQELDAALVLSKFLIDLRRINCFNRTNNVGWDDFDIMKEIGRGAYGTVFMVKKKTTGKLYAMKTVDWSDKVNEFFKEKFS